MDTKHKQGIRYRGKNNPLTPFCPLTPLSPALRKHTLKNIGFIKLENPRHKSSQVSPFSSVFNRTSTKWGWSRTKSLTQFFFVKKNNCDRVRVDFSVSSTPCPASKRYFGTGVVVEEGEKVSLSLALCPCYLRVWTSTAVRGYKFKARSFVKDILI